VLESKTYQRLGGREGLTADVRLITATHCNLEAAVADGAFRSDLLYRINAVTLELPPLRERRSDIDALCELFLAQSNRQWGLEIDGIEADAMALLRACRWPGNVRQLRNAIERAALVAPHTSLRVQDLPAYVRHQAGGAEAAVATGRAPAQDQAFGLPADGLRSSLRAYESRMIEAALQHTGGKRAAAAKLLRVPLRTFFRRLQEFGLDEPGKPQGS